MTLEDLVKIKEDLEVNKVAINGVTLEIVEVEEEIKGSTKCLEALKTQIPQDKDDLADCRRTLKYLRKEKGDLQHKEKLLLKERERLQLQEAGYVDALRKEWDDPHKRLKFEPLSIKENPKLYLEKLNDEFGAMFCVQLQEYCFPSESLNALETMKCGQTMDLDFLDPLRLPKKGERFLPSKIFIRQSMIDTFDLFRNDIEGERCDAGMQQTVLLGAPGVGKSVLFFLAALFQAQKFYTVYLRKTRSEKCISLFLMLPFDGSVRVWFTRVLVKDNLTSDGLSSLKKMVRVFNHVLQGELKDDDLYYFVDGPNHNEKGDTLDGVYDYFCTSGGHPLPKQAQQTTFRRWVLSGWTEPEAMDGLKAVYVKKEKSAALVSGRTEGESIYGSQADREESTDSIFRRAYDLCGGSIRNMIEACDNYNQHEKAIVELVKSLNENELEVALESSERSETTKSHDRIRMMFGGSDEESAIQAVDSRRVMQELLTKLSLEKWLKGYTLVSTMKDGHLKGKYFERCIHEWFAKKKPKPITSVCWSKGTTNEGIKQLTSPNMYWIPSVSNFANIDSAVVIGKKLYVLQMTTVMKGKKRNFDAEILLEKFVTKVRESFTALSLEPIVNVIFLVPLGSEMQFPAAHPSLAYTLHRVDMRGSSGLTRTMQWLPFLDRDGGNAPAVLHERRSSSCSI